MTTTVLPITYCRFEPVYGAVRSKIRKEGQELFVDIETRNLNILSINSVSTTDIKAPQEKIQRWLTRWKEGNPLSSYAIIEKKTKKMLGCITLQVPKERLTPTLSSIQGTVRLGYFSGLDSCSEEYGEEILHAVIQHFIPSLKDQDYKVANTAIQRIIATIDPDNESAEAILKTFMSVNHLRSGSKRCYQYFYPT